jgi:RNA polymerase sigma-70 factor, ECF subfamily
MRSEDLERQLSALMRAALSGDEAAYADFLRQCAELTRRAAQRRLGAASPVAPEDIVQETLLAVHLKRHTWRRNEPILPWLYAIARYKTIDACRRRGMRITIPIEDVAESLAAPEVQSASAESRHIERAVESLSAGQRRVVHAIAIEGRTISETATAFEMKETAVRVAFHRGLNSLSVRFGRSG